MPNSSQVLLCNYFITLFRRPLCFTRSFWWWLRHWSGVLFFKSLEIL